MDIHPVDSRWKLIIFDADGTLRYTTVEGQPCPNNQHEWSVMPNVREVLAHYSDRELSIVSNQAGVALGFLTYEMARRLLDYLAVAVFPDPARDRMVYLCHHDPKAECVCRKPSPYMLYQAIEEHAVKTSEVLFVGDMASDREAAERAKIDFMWASDFFGWNEHMHGQPPG